MLIRMDILPQWPLSQADKVEIEISNFKIAFFA